MDRAAAELVVLDSNRFTVFERIPLPDPTELAMSPDLSFLAVTNEGADSVSFVDIDPVSATFHQVVKTTAVGDGPTGIAWESENEDVLVCNEAGGSVSVIAAGTLEVRKTVTAFLTQPFAVATTPRQMGFGFDRGTYLAYILNLDGTLALFESGPDGVNGFGFDDVIGVAPFPLDNPRAIQADPIALTSAVWIAHENPLDLAGMPTGAPGGAVTQVRLTSTVSGVVPLLPGEQPNLRGFGFQVGVAVGSPELTGIPVDLAFDNQRNFGALPGHVNVFSAGSPAPINGKSQVRSLSTQIVNTSEPVFLFVAVPNSIFGPGVVDVLDGSAGYARFDTNPFLFGTQSVPAPGVSGLMDYFRQ